LATSGGGHTLRFRDLRIILAGHAGVVCDGEHSADVMKKRDGVLLIAHFAMSGIPRLAPLSSLAHNRNQIGSGRPGLDGLHIQRRRLRADLDEYAEGGFYYRFLCGESA